MKSISPALLALTLTVMLGGCGNPGEDACNALADAFAIRGSSPECQFGTESQLREAFIDTLVNSPPGVAAGASGCESVDEVADADTFYGTCVPGVEMAQCDTPESFGASLSAPACAGQLVFRIAR